MNSIFSWMHFGFGWCLAIAAAITGVYVTGYILFRCWGKLRVNAGGWHASGIDARGRIIVPALRLFGWFQPLMRAESAISRRVAKTFDLQPREQLISDVVVEVIPIS